MESKFLPHQHKRGSNAIFQVLLAIFFAQEQTAFIIRCMTKAPSAEILQLRSRFFESSVDLYAISDLNGEVLDVNAAMLNLFGFTRQEAIGQNWAQFVHEADLEASVREFEKTLRTGKSIGFMNRMRAKDGEYRLIEWDSSIDPDTNKIYSLGRDVSATRRSYETLNAKVSLQRAIIDSADFAIISTDADGNIQTFNRRSERMLGYTSEEVAGKASLTSFFDPDEVRDYADDLTQKFGNAVGKGMDVLFAKARAGLVEEGKFTLTKKSGHTFPAHISIGALRNDADEVYAFLFVARDITVEKRVENLKNEFISTVSHELRTPMTSIRGSLGLIAGGLAGEIPKEAKPLIDIAITSTDRLIRLVNDILDIEKIDSGKLEFKYKDAEVAPMIEQCIQANLPFASKHHVSYRFSKDSPSAKIRVDVDRFAQILDNLLSNAAKYTVEGDEIEVDMKCTDNRVRVSVTDHGKGIPDSFKPKVFAKFMQANQSDKRKTGGTGLGLAICRALVEQQGGRINFDSVEGHGTTFYFDFPVVD